MQLRIIWCKTLKMSCYREEVWGGGGGGGGEGGEGGGGNVLLQGGGVGKDRLLWCRTTNFIFI